MKITKKELARKIKALEGFVDYADNLLTQLNHALPEPIEIKHWRDEQSDYEELIEILDSKEPKLKQLDQSDFKDIDIDWNFLAVDSDGALFAFARKPNLHGAFWGNNNSSRFKRMSGKGCYDTTNWQNSLIERDKAELTGSDLCRAMLERGDKYISGFGHHYSDAAALDNKFADTVSKHTQCFQSSQNAWDYFVPINNQGEPLTQSDVGL